MPGVGKDVPPLPLAASPLADAFSRELAHGLPQEPIIFDGLLATSFCPILPHSFRHLIRTVLKPFFFLHESAIRPLTCKRRRISSRQFDLSNRKVTFRVRRPEIRQRKSSAFPGYRSTRHQFFKKPRSRVVLARPRTHESEQEPMTSLGLLIRFNKDKKCGYRNVRSRVHEA